MTQSIVSVGSALGYSLSSSSGPFTTVAQLRKAQPQGSKQTIVDQTNLSTAGNADAPLAVRYSGGELAIDGIVSPQDATQLELATLHENLTLAWWQVLLSDGVTTWEFQAFVSEYVPFTLDVNKAVAFSARLRLWGGYTAGTV